MPNETPEELVDHLNLVEVEPFSQSSDFHYKPHKIPGTVRVPFHLLHLPETTMAPSCSLAGAFSGRYLVADVSFNLETEKFRRARSGLISAVIFKHVY
jgi:hypothetical protein